MTWKRTEDLVKELREQNEELAKSLEKLHFWSGVVLCILVTLLISMVLDFVFGDKTLGQLFDW